MCLSSLFPLFKAHAHILTLCSKGDNIPMLIPLLLPSQPKCAVTMATDATETKHGMHLEVTEPKGPGKLENNVCF